MKNKKSNKNKYLTAKEYAEYIELNTKVEVLKRVFAKEWVLNFDSFNAIMGDEQKENKTINYNKKAI